MNASHDDMLDTIAALALGVLARDEAAAALEHARGCDACRAEYAALRPVANVLGLPAEAAPGELDDMTAARMRANVMESVRASASADSAPPARRASVPSANVVQLRERYAWLATAAAVILALAAFANVAWLRETDRHDAAVIADLRARNAASQTLVAALTAPGSKHYAVAQGEVVASNGRLYFAVKLPAAPPGKVYQAWTLHAGSHAVAPSVTFVPAADGTAFVELPESAGGIVAVALSVEPVGGSKAPTSKPAFVRPLS